MNKNSVSLVALLALALLISNPMPTKAAQSNFFLSPTPQSGNVGSTTSIDLALDSFVNLNAYQFKLTWNQQVLTFKNITFVWLSTQEPTSHIFNLEITGNELTAFEYFTNPDTAVTSTNKILVTITWNIIAGGECVLNMTEHTYWQPGPVEIPTTATNGYFFTKQPFVDFTWTPPGPRTGETLTYDGTASRATEMAVGDINMDGTVDSTDLGLMGASWGTFSGDPNWNPGCDLMPDGVVDSTDLGLLGFHWSTFGNYITSYNWWIDNINIGTGPTINHSYSSYSKTPHNVTLLVTDSKGYSFGLAKNHLVDRDPTILSIWPSMEDVQGSVQFEFVSGKYVVVGVRIANIGTITEYTDNFRGDFPGTAKLGLYLIHSDGTEQEIGNRVGKQFRRYWNSTGPDSFYRCYDWAPGVGTWYWKSWDLWGAAPETNLHFKANFTDTATGNDPFIGDTDLSNNELWFGPFNITARYNHDIRIEDIYNMDNGYYTPVPPYGTTFKYWYGGKYLNPLLGTIGPLPSIGPGNITTVYVDMANVGTNDEVGVEWKVYAGDTLIHTETDDLDVATGYFSFSFDWDTTGFLGTYTLKVRVDPVPGETDKWATWDNNLASQALPYFNAYDDWGIYNSFP